MRAIFKELLCERSIISRKVTINKETHIAQLLFDLIRFISIRLDMSK